MSELELWGLAKGDTISQDGSLREFRYSEFSNCASTPCNTAEPEYLPSQFYLSESLATSPPLDLQGANAELNHGFVRESSPNFLCPVRNVDQLYEGERCSPNSDGHGQSFSGSLGLPFFDEHLEPKACDSNFRHIYCDPRLLEEETQLSDFAELVSPHQHSRQLSHIQYSQTELERQEKSEPPLDVVKQDCCTTVKDFDDIIQRWHARKKSATCLRSSSTGSPLKLKQGSVEPSIADIGSLESKNSDPVSATKQKLPEAVSFDDIVQRWHNRKRISLPAVTDPTSSSDAGLFKKLRMTPEKTVELSTLELGQLLDQPVESSTVTEQENCSILRDECDEPLPDVLASGNDSETTEEDIDDNTAGIFTDDCDSFLKEDLPQRRLTLSYPRDMMSFLQPGVAKNHEVERKWSCPRKYRPGGRQCTMDSWIK